MQSFRKRKGNVQFHWSVYRYMFFSSVLAFVIGCICGAAVSYLDGSFLHQPDVSSLKQQEYTYFLTIAILSKFDNFARRQVIRSTWLSVKPRNDVHHVFVIGIEGLSAFAVSDLKKEQETYKDLLLLDKAQDSYQHLSTKMLLYFSWLDKTIKFTFVLKCDDDSFVHLDNVYYQLLSMEQKARLYMGFFDGRARVKKTGRWAEKNWILCDRYLPYAQGGGYILSHDIVSFIARNSDLLTKFNSEDVSVGVWTAPLKITRIHDPRFDTEFESRGCFNTYLITHKQSSEEMKQKYERLKKKGVICEKEFQRKKSYIYNWHVQPSMCCNRNNSKVP